MKLLLILSAFIALNATASEFYHQAPTGTNEYTVDVQAEHVLTRFANDNKTEGFDAILSFQYERGFADKFAAGVIAGFGYGESKEFGFEKDSDGLEDLDVYFKGFQPVSEGSFRYGLATMISLEDREVDSDGYSSRYSGGIWARIYLGYEHDSAPHVLGFRVSKEFSLEERFEDWEVGGDVEVEGSEDMEISFYIEKPKAEESYWGGSFSYTLISDREANGAPFENTSPIIRLQAYRPSRIGSSTFIPRLGFGFSPTDRVNGAELDEYTEVRLGLGYRF